MHVYMYSTPYLWWCQSQQQLPKRLLPAAAAGLRLLCVAAEEGVCLCCVATELRQPLTAQSWRCGAAAGLRQAR
jgi:hypothetical protein